MASVHWWPLQKVQGCLFGSVILTIDVNVNVDVNSSGWRLVLCILRGRDDIGTGAFLHCVSARG